MEVIGEPTFPILAEYDCSHTHPMITLPIGVIAELNAEDQSIAFK
jgi:muramoyltetrapeptide carboxypeptidase LdcA involved in peptidoglycan recycling